MGKLCVSAKCNRLTGNGKRLFAPPTLPPE